MVTSFKSCENIHNLVMYQLHICHILFPFFNHFIYPSPSLFLFCVLTFSILIPLPFIPLPFWSHCQRARTDSGNTEKESSSGKQRGIKKSLEYIMRLHSYSGIQGTLNEQFQYYFWNCTVKLFVTSENILSFKQGK